MKMRSSSGHRYLEIFLVVFLLAVLGLGVLYAQFGDYLPRFPPMTTCRVEQALGLKCPTCGGTRALESLLQGDLAQALRYNLFVVATLPLVAGYTGWAAWLVSRGRPLTHIGVPTWLPWVWLVFLVLFTAARNLL